VRNVWAFDSGGAPASPGGGLERVLPTGMMHVVIRLSPEPLTLFDDDTGANPRVVGHCLVGGARSTSYVRDVSAPSRSVGAQLHPGAASLLLGVPAGELAERHTPLDDLWGADAGRARERLAHAGSLEAELELFESMLAARLPRVRSLHPAVADALARFDEEARVADVVARSGYSHRAFISLFRGAVGLTPKVFCRVRRLERATRLITSGSAANLADVALAAGYADQAHCAREFAEIAGVSPARYRDLAPASANHVPVRSRAR
jgi:AraC-like DNA-binding protein